MFYKHLKNVQAVSTDFDLWSENEYEKDESEILLKSALGKLSQGEGMGKEKLFCARIY